MSDPLPSKGPWLNADVLPELALQTPPWIITASLLILVFTSWTAVSSKSKYPRINSPGFFQPQVLKQLDFVENGRKILTEGKRRFVDKPFRMLTETGDVIVLPPSFAHTIRNEADLSFGKALELDLHSNVPGFEPFAILKEDGQIAQTVIRKQLTKSLNVVTEPLSSEATFATNLIFGESSEWQEVRVKDSLLNLVARLSSRVFLGDELCRNAEWLELTKTYTLDAFGAAMKMSLIPRSLRFLYRLFSQDYKRVPLDRDAACDFIKPIIEERRAIKAKAHAEGKPVPTFDDAIEWAELESKGKPYNAVVFQLLLSFVAIHTTTDLLCKVMAILAKEPELIAPLREEMVRVLRAEGWKKSALYNLKLLDSAMKETQRVQAPLVSMRRIAVKDIVLPGGITIPRGQRVVVDASNMLDPNIFPEPDKYDMYRYFRMREDPATVNKAQFVSTSPDHLTFGHGMHACPGRFFAGNEVKIALCHLLLKYDWKLAPGTSVEPVKRGMFVSVNAETRLMFRRRKEEIDLESLEFN